MSGKAWTEADYAKLFAAVLACQDVKVNPNEVSKNLKAIGVERTAKAISHKIQAMKKIAGNIDATNVAATLPSTTRKRKEGPAVTTKKPQAKKSKAKQVNSEDEVQEELDIDGDA